MDCDNKDELLLYLQQKQIKIEGRSTKVNGGQSNKNTLPILAEYLSILATSVLSERLFSDITVSPNR
jgi:hypothetical protein